MQVYDPSAQMLAVSDKRVHLNHPGSVVTNIYYTKNNVTMQESQVTFEIGRYSQSLNSLNFGSQSTVVIPRDALLRNCYLHFVLPPVVADQTLPRGYGYSLIDYVNYSLGSSNSSFVTINGQANLQAVMCEAGSSDKRNELLRLGGQQYVNPTTGNVEADVILSLPFSQAGCCKYPIDTNLLSSNITIQIKLVEANKIYGGSGAKPTSLLSAELICAQGHMANKALSLKTFLSMYPEERYIYPFVHKQSEVYDITATAGTQVNQNLLSFLNADLLAISFVLVKKDRVYDPTGAQPPNPLLYSDVQDIRLSLGNNDYYKAPGQSYKLFNMQDLGGASYMENSAIGPGIVAPFTTTAKDSYIVQMNFSQNPSYIYHQRWYNTFRIGNNTLNLKFTPVDESGDFLLYTCYYYNAEASINGDTMLLFD